MDLAEGGKDGRMGLEEVAGEHFLPRCGMRVESGLIYVEGRRLDVWSIPRL